jgi:hypothetical protein
MILNFDDFINEAKKNKDESIDLLLKFFKEKPSIKFDSKTFPDEKDIYTLAGIKKYFVENGLEKGDVDSALYTIRNNKEYKQHKIEIAYAKNYHYDKQQPYLYMNLSKDQVDKAVEKLEAASKEMSKGEIEKREASKKKPATAKKTAAKKTTTAKKPTTARKTSTRSTKK